MNPKDGPGVVDVLVAIFSPLIVMAMMFLMMVGYFLLAPWGRD